MAPTPSSTSRAVGTPDATYLIAVIGDEDTVTGFLLAGVGQNDQRKDPNYFVVDPKTTTDSEIEQVFTSFTTREDVAIILVNQFIANRIRQTVSAFKRTHPAILEIPSKEHQYDPASDPLLRRVQAMLGFQE